MFEKHLLHRMLTAVVQNGGLRVAYWDGDTQTYGANPEITVRLRGPAAAWAIITRGSIGVGEAYQPVA